MSAAIGLFRLALHRADVALDRLAHPESYRAYDRSSRQRTPGSPAPAVIPRRPVRGNRPSLAECLDFFCPPGP